MPSLCMFWMRIRTKRIYEPTIFCFICHSRIMLYMNSFWIMYTTIFHIYFFFMQPNEVFGCQRIFLFMLFHIYKSLMPPVRGSWWLYHHTYSDLCKNHKLALCLTYIIWRLTAHTRSSRLINKWSASATQSVDTRAFPRIEHNPQLKGISLQNSNCATSPCEITPLK
jgi:hypothetical protein